MNDRPADAHGWEDGYEDRDGVLPLRPIELPDYEEAFREMQEHILASFALPAHLLQGENYSSLHAAEKQFNERR